MLKGLFISCAITAALVFISPAQAQDKPVRIGLASLQRILNELQEAKDINAQMETRKKELDKTSADKQQALQLLKQSLQQDLKPGTPQYEDRRKEFVSKFVEAKSWSELMQEDMQRQQKMNMRTMFDKIEQGVADVAAKKGLDIVMPDLRQPFPDTVDQVTIDQLRDFIRTRNLLYAQPSLDITSDVIALLDAKYKEKK